MSELTHSRLTELLHYRQDDGVFIWKIDRKKIKAGSIAGSKHNMGYCSIYVDNKPYLAHRLAWFYVYKMWPVFVVDHINQIKSDNRICNLRSVTQKENGKNTQLSKSNSSGVTGVRFATDGRKNPWYARVMHGRKEKSLGHYPTFDEAVQARQKWNDDFWSKT